MGYFNESLEYTLRNISDIVFCPFVPSDINYSLLKMNKTYKEFFRHYKMTKKTASQILKAINKFDSTSKTSSIININELEKFVHRRQQLIIATGGKEKFFVNNDTATLYALLFRYRMNSEMRDINTYTALIPIPPKKDFIVFITFDENQIYKVQSVASNNQYDLYAKIELVDLDVEIK